MLFDGYGIATLDDANWNSNSGGGVRTDLTSSLGCSQLTVEAFRLESNNSFSPPPARENVCLTLIGRSTLRLNDGTDVPSTGIVRIGGERTETIQATEKCTVIVVGADSNSSVQSKPVVVDLDTREFHIPSTSDIATAHLTEPLGCTRMKVNARILDPGDFVPYHTEGGQEELFVPLADSASMRIDDKSYSTPRGTIVRVAPSVPRSAMNPGNKRVIWVMFGAPPSGGPTDWDPGAKILE